MSTSTSPAINPTLVSSRSRDRVRCFCWGRGFYGSCIQRELSGKRLDQTSRWVIGSKHNGTIGSGKGNDRDGGARVEFHCVTGSRKRGREQNTGTGGGGEVDGRGGEEGRRSLPTSEVTSIR